MQKTARTSQLQAAALSTAKQQIMLPYRHDQATVLIQLPENRGLQYWHFTCLHNN